MRSGVCAVRLRLPVATQLTPSREQTERGRTQQQPFSAPENTGIGQGKASSAQTEPGEQARQRQVKIIHYGSAPLNRPVEEEGEEDDPFHWCVT